jgi:hypothetical protein
VGRPAALLGLAVWAALLVYYETSSRWWQAGVWWDVAWLALVLIPAVFSLVLLALPLNTARGLLPVGLAFAVLAGVLTWAHFDVFANFSRLAATTLLGWWFLGWFETVGVVLIVACIIPWVDAYSVWRGPTKTILAHHEHVFTNALSFAFPVPGEHSAANLGLPDLLFFGLFLGAAARFGLRVGWTWIALTAALGLTIAAAVWWDLGGLPALPGVALGFLVPNADLLWAYVRRRNSPVRDTMSV